MNKKLALIATVVVMVAALAGCGYNTEDAAIHSKVTLDAKVVKTSCSPCGKGRRDTVFIEKNDVKKEYYIVGDEIASDTFDNIIKLAKNLGLENRVDIITNGDDILGVSLSKNRDQQ